MPAREAPGSAAIPIGAPTIPPLAAPMPHLDEPASPQARGPGSLPAVRPAAAADALPAPRLLPVIGGLIAFGLAGVVSGVISFQSAAATQARIDAARAHFFPRPGGDSR
ncbi:hypothetical protein [Nocardia beijingensis]